MLKILMAQLNYVAGDCSGNAKKMLDLVVKQGNNVDLIVFSELSVTGYYPHDFIDRVGFIDDQNQQLDLIRKATAGIRAAVVVGHMTRNPFAGKDFFNSLSVYENGRISLTYHKQLLCDYDIFNEPRHFEPGSRPGLMELKGKRLGFLICEDAWYRSNAAGPLYRIDPVSNLEHEKLDLIVSINASPSNVQKQAARRQASGDLARRCNCPVVYVNQVGGYDDIVYDGDSLVVSRSGGVSYALGAFRESVGAVELHDSGTISSCNVPETDSLGVNPVPMESIPLIYEQTVTGIRDYIRKCGFKGAVVGCSGGVDSAVTIALAVQALGCENVFAITMPSRFSSDGSVDDSVELCRNLGVRLYNDPIEDEFAAWLDGYEAVYGKRPDRLTLENKQARIRGSKIMAFSNDNPGIMALTTGNKSELSEGYCTLYGDMCGGLNVLGDIYKTQVYAIGEYYNSVHGPQIPESIFSKAPSAELSEGQKDSDSLLPYEILDPLLMLYIEFNSLSAEEIVAYRRIISETPLKELERAIRLVDRAQFKRDQGARIIRVQRRSFGPGWQIPIAGQYNNDRYIKNILGREA